MAANCFVLGTTKIAEGVSCQSYLHGINQDFSHLGSQDFSNVYEPAEDTFLLLDALEADADFLKKLKACICLEVGSGSGVVSAFLSKLLQNSAFHCCTDINWDAAVATKLTSEKNNVNLNPVLMDLAGSFMPRMAGLVDILIFNPPYVVTPSSEVGGMNIEASWAGGVNGREVMDRLFPSVPSLLSPHGVFYLVVIKENIPSQIEALMLCFNFEMKSILSRRSGPEFLSILRFTRRT